MRTISLTVVLLLNFLISFGQEIFTGSILIEETEYAGITGNLPQTSVASLPSSIDLSIYLPPVGNQGNQNSCVAWAIAYGAQTYYAKKGKDNWTFTNSSGQLNYDNLFSPSFVYNQINGGVDNGSSYINALNLLKDQGVCTWNSMPYSDNDFRSVPTQMAKQQAVNFKIERYFRLGERQNLFSDVKEQLANSHPVIASAISDINYLRGGYGNNPNTPYVWQTIGNFDPRMGHAILIVGYDDNRQAFKFLNSYGKTWGNDGFGWISYSVFNGVVKQAFIMKPSFSDSYTVNNILTENRNNLNNNDINIGLNLSITNVQHMNSSSHPQILPQNRYMTITGLLSVPNKTGNSAQIIIYYYLVAPSGRRTPLQGYIPEFKLQSGQAISSTPPISTSQGLLNLGWCSTIPYFAFPRYASFSTPPQTYVVEAEPALIIDNYPVRLGRTFRFTVTQ
ncbi:C1 family peptidase [Flavobacterium sp. UBA4197]|uniref:C1 family peptidase n=1 Tax=Flavobacterium sp. UBA4197 TaxID=1946546 RepID=UPI00257B3E14|nr:C1 family peptidase [Flavobacterium sp. UBA4197]